MTWPSKFPLSLSTSNYGSCDWFLEEYIFLEGQQLPIFELLAMSSLGEMLTWLPSIVGITLFSERAGWNFIFIVFNIEIIEFGCRRTRDPKFRPDNYSSFFFLR